MQVEFVNPFISATHDVFRTMLKCELSRGPLALKNGHTPEFEVSGLIGLTGTCQGMVVVSLGRETALRATEILRGEKYESLNAQVVDAVGELANMIAGAAKSRLGENRFAMGLPSVICGKHHTINFPTSSKPIQLPFGSSIGPICVEFGFAERQL
jgi:chemotaxis protein CheX